MPKKRVLNLDELSPYVCKAGRQNQVPWKTRSRRIYDHELIYCSSGKAHVVINDIEYTMNPRSLILINPDVPHRFWKDEKSPGEQYWVHFDFVYRKDVYDMDRFMSSNNGMLFCETLPFSSFIREDIVFENGFSFPEFIEEVNSDIIELNFRKLLKCFEDHNAFWQLECKVYLLQILNSILHQLNGDQTYIVVKDDNSVAKEIMRYIYRNYFRKISVKEIGTLVGLSEDYVGKVFKKQTGMTITRFITDIRLQKAKDLLLQTDLNLENIAEMVGYSDAFYLSKAMKKATNMSPSLFKKLRK